MTREQAAVAGQQTEEREKLMWLGGGLVGAGGLIFLVLNGLNKSGREQSRRPRFDDDFPTP